MARSNKSLIKIAKILGSVLGIYIVVTLGIAFALALFGRLEAPKPLKSVTDPFAKMDLTNLPAIERYPARDGAELSYRTYKGTEDQAAILIHGSAGSSSDMHELALALQKAGVTVFVPDLRGHGANFPHGDISYTGQLDDDMADFLKKIKPLHPTAKWTLLGFSSGGGFVLRMAATSLGQDFDDYILLSPYLRYNAPTIRAVSPANGANPGSIWCSVATNRIIGLTILGSFGIHHLDGLPVLAFPVPSDSMFTTSTYSFRMEQNFEPHTDYMKDISSVSRPMEVLVGEKDELFIPKEFSSVFDAKRQDIPVTILPGLGHVDMITSAAAIHTIVAMFKQEQR